MINCLPRVAIVEEGERTVARGILLGYSVSIKCHLNVEVSVGSRGAEFDEGLD